MTREEFIGVLYNRGYSYEILGDSIIVTHEGNVELEQLKSITFGVVFNSGWNVDLSALKIISTGVVFNNKRNVDLGALEKLPSGVEFNNGGWVFLYSLKTISSGVVFKNVGEINLKTLTGAVFHEWEGNIEGVDSNRLLNLMISKGIFL